MSYHQSHSHYSGDAIYVDAEPTYADAKSACMGRSRSNASSRSIDSAYESMGSPPAAENYTYFQYGSGYHTYDATNYDDADFETVVKQEYEDEVEYDFSHPDQGSITPTIATAAYGTPAACYSPVSP